MCDSNLICKLFLCDTSVQGHSSIIRHVHYISIIWHAIPRSTYSLRWIIENNRKTIWWIISLSYEDLGNCNLETEIFTAAILDSVRPSSDLILSFQSRASVLIRNLISILSAMRYIMIQPHESEVRFRVLMSTYTITKIVLSYPSV